MNVEPVPFDDLPDDVQAFLFECFGEAIRRPVVFFSTPWTADDPFKKWLPEKAQPTATTHVLHVRTDGSHQYHSADFQFWG